MSYLIFGIVVMLVTWWITKKENNRLTDFQLKHIYALENRIFTKDKQIEELKSELITQKAMRENK